jgi:CheY-like chemotaxis protein
MNASLLSSLTKKINSRMSTENQSAPAAASGPASSVSVYGADLKPYVDRMNDLGPWANLFGVLTFLGSLILGARWAYRKFIHRDVPKTISSWISENYGAAAGEITQKCRKHIKIALVDDQPQDFDTAVLTGLSYRLSTYQKIGLAEIDSLRAFDLVILDITNVVPEDAAKGGLHVIRKLKSGEIRPIVIAVSGKRYDPSVTEFFQLADMQLKKPVTAHALSDAVDKLLRPSFTLAGIASSIDREIAGNGFAPPDLIKSLNRKIISAIKKKKSLRAKAAFDDVAKTEKINSLLSRCANLRGINGYH